MSSDSSRNSGSKSKRSFNSVHSNPSSSTSNGGKKKKSEQKTLGVAWGASSRSSSRSAFRSSPFSDFGSYMVVKNRKLHEQFDAEASSSSHSGSVVERPIFHGVSIFVDGYTVPSSQELRGYMLKHGGRFENYFSRHRVTHIICSNLPDSKIKNLRSFSCGLPVVKPSWLLDSVAANKLLSWIPYQLDQLASSSKNQPKLSAFFSLKNSGESENVSPYVADHVKSETENPSAEGYNGGASDFIEESESTRETKQCTVEQSGLVRIAVDEPACSTESHIESKRVNEISTLDARNGIDNNSKGSSTSRISLPSNLRHSTLTDSNFVENYFKSSRLHFIGTWRSRYRKRFPCSSTGIRHESSNSDLSSITQNTAIIHVDMDCFFVSVVIRNRPELLDKPVAVCHSDNPRGTSEISSANYPARDHGIKAGMFVKDAKALCPHLMIVPYDFGAYEKVADQLYDILHRHCNRVQAVSCDEAFLDVSDSKVEDPELLASNIRKEILETTGCTASAGIAGNMLMARLATKTAKPDGQCYIPPEKVDSYLCALPVKELPGIGHVLHQKLKKRHIETCGQLRSIPKESLQKEFGPKTGDMLWNYSRGIDNRLVGIIQESKSVGAEVNWGVRFRDTNDVQHFLVKLCKEVSLRLQGCGVQGRCFTLKVKKRKDDAGEPVKYMGCGDCENLSHSTTVPVATDEADVLHRISTQLFRHFHIDVKDIRGMGMQVSKLESADSSKPGQESNSILSWFASPKESRDRRRNSAASHGDIALPPLHDLDPGVIQSLPLEVISEINDMYGGKLTSFFSKNKGKGVETDMPAGYKNGAVVEVSSSWAQLTGANENPVEIEVEDNSGRDVSLPCSLSSAVKEDLQCDGDRIPAIPSPVLESSLMPSSLSQVDRSVLQQLPEELKRDILGGLPAHRRTESFGHSSIRCTENKPESRDSLLTNELWAGNPPHWVVNFKCSSAGMLNLFANIYCRSAPNVPLSSILEQLIVEIHRPTWVDSDGHSDALSCLCELFKQYIEVKVGTDLEEIYVCIRLLRRLTDRSKFFEQVHNNILPPVQALIGEKYGGTLNISVLK